MTQELLTVEAAADALKLHPKTVLRFIREGKLKANKVGRAFRITRGDLNAFAGLGEPAPRTASNARATVILDVDDLTIDEAQRIITAVQAAIAGPKPHPIQVETTYDRHRRGLKLIIIATPEDAQALLAVVSQLTQT